MEKHEKIYVAGHTGLFGSAIVRQLRNEGYSNIITKTHSELDLTDGRKTKEFFLREKPDFVFVAAAKVGGIYANNVYMADFAMENLLITCNILKSAHEVKVKKLLYLGSSCIYPCSAKQPVKEEYLLQGLLEPTNEGYAIAKIAGIKMCDYYMKQYGDNFISCIPANVYGPNDNFEENNNHVIPALIQRFHIAKKRDSPCVDIWGSGTAEREFLYIDDAAQACIFVMNKYAGPGTINIGLGKTTSIHELADLICKVVDYNGKICFDHTKPDGMPKRLLDSKKIFDLGWKPKMDLLSGLKIEYDWYLNNKESR